LPFIKFSRQNRRISPQILKFDRVNLRPPDKARNLSFILAILAYNRFVAIRGGAY